MDLCKVENIHSTFHPPIHPSIHNARQLSADNPPEAPPEAPRVYIQNASVCAVKNARVSHVPKLSSTSCGRREEGHGRKCGAALASACAEAPRGQAHHTEQVTGEHWHWMRAGKPWPHRRRCCRDWMLERSLHEEAPGSQTMPTALPAHGCGGGGTGKQQLQHPSH